MQDHVQQRLMDMDATVVLNKAHLPEAIHEEANPRAGRADHVGQRFLRDRRDQRLLLSGLAELCHQEQYPRKALFAGIEELIDEVCLCPKTARQEESYKHVGEAVFFVDHTNHLLPFDFEHGTSGDGARSCQPQTEYAGDRLLANEVSSGEKRNSSLFACLGNDRELSATLLEEKMESAEFPCEKKMPFAFR